ncbi:MAG: purine-nucleoside phosphorylase [Ruminococcaceae bacterium]|nr:purine-nucleoside phosphorylase [Oscillospiraceae bacterium]
MATKTPHIELLDEALGFGKTVLMPGDPKRAKFIAENFLENAVLVNSVRGINGYTGFYKGVKVSVMASGMGIPSIGIYSYELYRYFGVQNIMRIGSAGAISNKVNLRDIVVGMSACTNSDFAKQYGLCGTIAPTCDFAMLDTLNQTAKDMNLPLNIGSLYSSDTFYDDTRKAVDWGKMGCLAVEMEAAGLYCTAMRLGMRALAVCTISDLVYPPFDSLDAAERERSFTQMMELALETAVRLENLEKLTPKE